MRLRDLGGYQRRDRLEAHAARMRARVPVRITRIRQAMALMCHPRTEDDPVTEIEKRVLAVIGSEWMAQPEVSVASGVSRTGVLRAFSRLWRAGLVEREWRRSPSKNWRWYVRRFEEAAE